MSELILKLDNLLWNPLPILKDIPIIGWLCPLAVLLVGTGIYFTIRLKFVQIREFKVGVNGLINGFGGENDHQKGLVSSFQSLCLAVAGQVGTGNIVGASTAIAVGGPGAIFWMWIAAFFGMATIFVEAQLAQKFKIVLSDGRTSGGPVYYILAAFKGKLGKFLAFLFSVLTILSLGIMGTAVQSNGITSAWMTVAQSAGLSERNVNMIVLAIGIFIALFSLFVFLGGRKAIVSFTQNCVPFMALIYIIGSLIAIILNIKFVPNMFYMIMKGAFRGESIVGGSAGWLISQALSKGVSRGLFSNEAGMGSTPHAHAVAKVDHPSSQGYIAMIGVFIDTFIILNLTAFVVISSPSFLSFCASGYSGVTLSQAAFSEKFGSFGNYFIAISLSLFAFSTIIGWYFCSLSNWDYLFNGKFKVLCSILSSLGVFFGSYVVVLKYNVNDLWNLQDALNGLLVIPNLLAILALSNVAVVLLNESRKKRLSKLT